MMIDIKKSIFKSIFQLPLKNKAMRAHISDDLEAIRVSTFMLDPFRSGQDHGEGGLI